MLLYTTVHTLLTNNLILLKTFFQDNAAKMVIILYPLIQLVLEMIHLIIHSLFYRYILPFFREKLPAFLNLCCSYFHIIFLYKVLKLFRKCNGEDHLNNRPHLIFLSDLEILLIKELLHFYNPYSPLLSGKSISKITNYSFSNRFVMCI